MGNHRAPKDVPRTKEGRIPKLTKVSMAKKRRYLKEYPKYGNMTATAKKIGISRELVTKWLQADPEFAENHEEAEKEYCDNIVNEVNRRAIEGEPTKVGWYKGVAGGIEMKKSDRLLTELARAKIPAFRPTVEINQDSNLRITVDDARVRLAAMLSNNPQLEKQLVDLMGEGARATMFRVKNEAPDAKKALPSPSGVVEGGGDPPKAHEDEGISPSLFPTDFNHE